MITQLKDQLARLVNGLIDKFGKVSTAFRAFDVRTKGFVTFADFAYILEKVKLGIERD